MCVWCGVLWTVKFVVKLLALLGVTRDEGGHDVRGVGVEPRDVEHVWVARNRNRLPVACETEDDELGATISRVAHDAVVHSEGVFAAESATVRVVVGDHDEGTRW